MGALSPMPRRRPSRHHASLDGSLLPPGVAAAVRTRDGEMLVESLAPLVTEHANSLRGAHKFALYKVAEAELADPAVARRWAAELSKRKEPIAKQFAMYLVALHAGDPAEHADAVVPVLERGADDENWEVRETAGSVLARLIVAAPLPFTRLARTWSRSPSPNLRRAVVLALKYAVREEPRRAEEFLDILDPLAADGDEYVRKNLGPFAVGDAFLRVAPDPTMKRLERWARSKDEWTRWNAVSAFTAAGARRHAAEALPLLRIAAGDRRPMVSRAVVRALLNLAQAERTAVVKAVATWGEDEARRTTASAFSSRLMGRSM
jgi:HEAT repeat protein